MTEKSDPELFFAMPWSCGTAGFLVGITVRLVRTKPYVRIRYEPTSSPEQLTARLSELARAGDNAPVFLEACRRLLHHDLHHSTFISTTSIVARRRCTRATRP